MADSEVVELDGGGKPKGRGLGKRIVVTLVKILVAVAGLCFVLTKPGWSKPMTGERWVKVAGIYFAPAFHWDDTAIFPKGGKVRAVEFDEDVLVHVMPAGGRGVVAKEGTVRIAFPQDEAVAVKLEDGRAVSVVIGEETAVPGGGAQERLGVPAVIDFPAKDLKLVRGETVQPGVRKMLLDARGKWYLIVAAWLILVIPFLVSAVRWRALMRPQGIEMPLGKCVQLTFVGQFYSIMLPGVTGGDLVKIIYAARLTGSKTKSIVTILLDRVVGLVALMVIAGLAAGWQLWQNKLGGQVAAGGGPGQDEARNILLRNVLLLIGGIFALMVVGATVYFSRRLRALTGLQRIIDHPRMPDFVKHADEVLHVYRGHTGLLVWAFLISLGSQLVLPLSAWMCGMAFGMEANVGYYLAFVPIAVLAASMPISPPQGFGVMDFILMHFFATRGGAKAGQVFALTQAIRFLPILWNLVGAYWVITGRFSRRETVQEGIEVGEEPAQMTKSEYE
jgi:uncharacterized membrane protein YbhN (UPF0104 family)